MGNRKYKHYAVKETFVTRIMKNKQLSLSVISLILAAMVLVSATYCWYALANGQATGNNVKLTVGNGLRVNDLGDTSQKFKDDSFLLPASSVDGRNLFFPTDGTDFSSETPKMSFRSANAGDRNYDYVQLDFNLTAEANYTSIYLDKTTSLKIEVPDGLSGDALSAYEAQAAQAEKAIRAAIYYDKMDKPVVFTSQMNPVSVDAVKDIDRTTGRFLESGTQVAVPFKDYFYGKKQLAMLNQGETRPFSLLIWLEGTDQNCTGAAVMLKQLVLNLTFTTSWDNTSEIIFEDSTTNKDVRQLLKEHPAYSLVLDYNDSDHKIDHMKFTMQKVNATEDNYQWKCNIPGNAYNDLTFQIVDGANSNAVVYEWSKSTAGVSTKNRGTATTYFVDSVNATDSRGHWFDGDIEGHGEGHDSGIVDDDDW